MKWISLSAGTAGYKLKFKAVSVGECIEQMKAPNHKMIKKIEQISQNDGGW